MSDPVKSTGNTLFNDGRYRLAMGLIPLDASEWLAPGANLVERLVAKRHLLATRHHDVFRAMPEADSAAHYLLAFFADHLPRHYPSVYQHHGGMLTNRSTGETWDIAAQALHPLDLCGRLVEEDLCLMQAHADS